VLSKLALQLPQRAVGQAELLSDLLGLAAFDEHGAQRFVAAVIGIGWLREERPARGIIHDVCSLEMSIGFWRRAGGNAIGTGRPGDAQTASNRVKSDSGRWVRHAQGPRPASAHKPSGTENRLTTGAKNTGKTGQNRLKVSVDLVATEIGV
jgi:hypothetical protein